MDKRLVHAVAGSGKTRMIIESLGLNKRFLILTYTEANLSNLKSRIRQRFGLIPENITVLSYFNFLYSHCYRPFLSKKCRAKGISWDIPPSWTLRKKRTDPKFYFTAHHQLYHNRIAKLLEVTDTIVHAKERLEKYFDVFMIDEIQDLGGHDFDFISHLSKAAVEMLFVGDFYQHTFDTSRDGPTNATLHNDYAKYLDKFRQLSLVIDERSLNASYRCSAEICAFVTEKLKINMQPANARSGQITFIEEKDTALNLFSCNKTVKLFYQSHDKYPCYSKNWGKSKGEDCYEDVCVILNKTTHKHFKADTLHKLAPSTKNKFYVACTRAKGDLYFVPENLIAEMKSE